MSLESWNTDSQFKVRAAHIFPFCMTHDFIICSNRLQDLVDNGFTGVFILFVDLGVKGSCNISSLHLWLWLSEVRICINTTFVLFLILVESSSVWSQLVTLNKEGVGISLIWLCYCQQLKFQTVKCKPASVQVPLLKQSYSCCNNP